MILDRLYQWARIQPHKTALINDGVAMDYATFVRAIELTCTFLERQRLPAGSTAALLIEDLAKSWVVGVAMRSIGLNTIAVSSVSQMRQLQVRDLSCVITVEGREAGPGHRIREIVVPTAAYADLHRGGLAAPSRTHLPYGGHILFTSGTTGSFKKIMMPSEREDGSNARRAEVLSIDGDSVLHGLDFAPWTGAGYKQPLAAWHIGACIIFNHTKNWLDNIFKSGVTRVFLTPSQIRTLLASRAQIHNATVLGDCVISVSSGFLSSELAERAVRELSTKLVVQYSATELIDVPLESWYRRRDDQMWLHVANDCDVEIVDGSGRQCSPEEEGEIRVARKEWDATCYLDNDQASARVFRDGYFYPGDLGMRRLDGRIRILGRVEDVINLGGEKIAVAPIEQDIQRFLRVDEVCLFGHLNDAGQEELIVAIQSSSRPPQARLDQIRRSFRSFDKVRFPVMKAFPRNETGTGKVRRASLKSLVAKSSEL